MRRFPFLAIPLATVLFSLLSLGISPDALGQDESNKEQAKPSAKTKAEDSVDNKSVLGLDEVTSERLLSSLRRGALSENVAVSYRSLKMFSDHPELHRGLDKGVQLELVKHAIKQNDTVSSGFDILAQSEIEGIEREDLLLALFKLSFRENSEIETQQILYALSTVRESLVDRFALEIEKDPLGDHTNKLLVIEHLGSSAEKVLPALLKRYHALKDLAVSEGRAVNYKDVLFAVGEIRSQDGMEIILDAINERGSDDREQYALIGFECLDRIVEYSNDDVPELSRAYLEYAQELIKKYDKDSDGLLSRDEAAKMRRPVDMDFDRNRDMKLSEKEIAWGVARGRPQSRTNRSRSSSRSSRSKLIRNSVGYN